MRIDGVYIVVGVSLLGKPVLHLEVVLDEGTQGRGISRGELSCVDVVIYFH